MPGFGGAIKLTGEESYRKALQNITQNLKVISAEMKATTTAFQSGDKTMGQLSRDTEKLKASLTAQKSALATLKQELSKATNAYEKAGREHKTLVSEYEKEKAKLTQLERTVGTASKEYKVQAKVVDNLSKEVKQSEKEYLAQGNAVNKMKIQTANAETTLNKTAIALDKVGDEADETARETKAVGVSMSSAEKASSGMSEGFTVAKGIMANLATQAIELAAGALTALVSGLKSVADAAVQTVNEVGQLGDEIDKESQKLSVSASLYQSLDYAMQRSGASIDDVKMGLRNITNAIADTENGVKGASDKFDQLGISLSNADGSMKQSEDVLLETIDVLASMTDETQRNALANDIFGRSYQELKPLLNTGADGIKALMNEAEAYGMVMSDEAVKASAAFEDALLKMNGTLDGLRNNIVGGFLPGINDMIDGFTDLVVGNAVASVEIEKGFNKIIDQLTSLTPQVKDFIKQLSANVKRMIPEISSLVKQTIPLLVELGATIIVSVLEGMTEATPDLLREIPGMMTDIINSFTENSEKIMIAGMDMIESIGDGMMKGLPKLIKQLPVIVDKYVESGKKVWSKAGQMGADLIKALVDGINDSLPVLTEAVPEIIGDFADGITDMSDEIIQIATSIMETLADGLIQMLPLITDFVVAMIDVYANVVSNNLPTIIKAGVEILKAIVKGFAKSTPELLKLIPKLMVSVAKSLLDNLPKMANAGVQIVKSLITGINSMMTTLAASSLKMATTVITELSKLPTKAAELGTQTAKAFIAKINEILPQVVNFGRDLLNRFKDIVSDVSTALKDLPANVATMAKDVVSKFEGLAGDIVNALKNLPAKVVEIGKEIVSGLWKGIQDKSQWLKTQLDTFCENFKKQVKEKFGIKSPSRVMRDEVGKYLAEGIGVGFEDRMADVSARMQDAIPSRFSLNPTLSNATGYTAGDYSYETMVAAFRDALEQVKIELDDEKVGRFVDKTVTRLVFN